MPQKRKIITEGDTSYIPLTRGYQAVIDSEDLNLVEGFNWFSVKVRHHVYAGRRDGERLLFLHQSILPTDKNLVVDHIDGDGLNNRRNNLRSATRSQNSQNSKKPNRNTSGYKGVYWDKERSKFRAAIVVNKKILQIGRFECPKMAHEAYCHASAKFHGEFGRVE